MLLTAAVVVQVVTWLCAVLSITINILLILGIRREKRTDNRFRWFNSIFLYSAYSNTILAIIFPLFHPTYVPAQHFIYVIFIGPLARIFPKGLLKIFYCLLVGILTYQVCIAPITLVLRWLVVQRRIYCTVFHYKTIRIFFAMTSIPLPFAIWAYMSFMKSSRKLQAFTEKSHQDAVWKLTCGNYEYLVTDLNFSYLILTFTIPYLIFFAISLLFHRFFMKSIRNNQNDCIGMGYHDSLTINQTLLSMALQNFVLITFPHVSLIITVYLKWELGVRALPISFGCMCTALTTAITLFIHFRAYRRQIGFLTIELLRQNNVPVPIFVINNQQTSSSNYQMSAISH